jgi:hypothetical protein
MADADGETKAVVVVASMSLGVLLVIYGVFHFVAWRNEFSPILDPGVPSGGVALLMASAILGLPALVAYPILMSAAANRTQTGGSVAWLHVTCACFVASFGGCILAWRVRMEPLFEDVTGLVLTCIAVTILLIISPVVALGHLLKTNSAAAAAAKVRAEAEAAKAKAAKAKAKAASLRDHSSLLRCSGDRNQRTLLMFHGTKRDLAKKIEASGFNPSIRGMLGPGVYCSRDIEKARHYGPVTHGADGVILLCRVEANRVKVFSTKSEDLTVWQSEGYDIAWVQPNVQSTGEEDCVREASRVRLVGYMKPTARHLRTDAVGSNQHIAPHVERYVANVDLDVRQRMVYHL